MNGNEFDLLIHEWIPCLTGEGPLTLFSLRTALEKAHQIRSIEHESPVVRLAVLRLLMAFCYRLAYANGLPIDSFRNWRALSTVWKKEGIPPGWIDHYLDEYRCRNRFRLFDDRYPFFQVAGLTCQGANQPEPATRLAFEQFAGTPSSLWEHSPEVPTVPEAALFLVTSQAFGASASNTSNAMVGVLDYSPTGRTFAPAYSGCIVWLEGDNLLESLLLNLADYDLTDTDLPVWEKPLNIELLRARQPRKAGEGDLDLNGRQIKVGKKIGDPKAASPTGPVQLFTWPSRAVLLIEPADGKVERVHFTQGLSLKDSPIDPMKPYNSKGDPIALQRHKAAWRDLHSLLALQPNQNRTVKALSLAVRSGLPTARLNIAGIARGDEAAKILFWRHERIPLPAKLLDDINLIERLGQLIQEAENVASELNDRTRKIAALYLSPEMESGSKRKADKADIKKIANVIDPRPAYWARLEKPFLNLVQSIANDWDAAIDDWKPDAQQHKSITWRKNIKFEARRSLEESVRCLGSTARAIQAIARVRTDFNNADLKPKPLKTARAKQKEVQRNETRR